MHRDWGSRSAGDLETGLFDLDDEIAGKRASTHSAPWIPLPRLGDDILVEPSARGFVQRRIEMLVP